MYEVLLRYKEQVLNREEMKLPDEAVISCIISCYFGILWKQDALLKTTERDTTASDVGILRNMLDRYMELAQVSHIAFNVTQIWICSCPSISLLQSRSNFIRFIQGHSC
jgi:hypothetical protein